MHGGGFVFGSVKDRLNDNFAHTLANELGVYVLAVEYSLAPENKFPDALEDCYSVLHYLNSGDADWIYGRGEFSELYPMNLRNVFVGGVSAGGNLAISSKLLWRDRQISMQKSDSISFHPHHHQYEYSNIHILGEVLVTPDFMRNQRDETFNMDRYILDGEQVEKMRNMYLRDDVCLEEQKNHLYISILSNLDKKFNLETFIYSYKSSVYFEENRDMAENLRNKNINIRTTYRVNSPHCAAMVNEDGHLFDMIAEFVSERIEEFYTQA